MAVTVGAAVELHNDSFGAAHLPDGLQEPLEPLAGQPGNSRQAQRLCLLAEARFRVEPIQLVEQVGPRRLTKPLNWDLQLLSQLHSWSLQGERDETNAVAFGDGLAQPRQKAAAANCVGERFF